MTTFTIQVKNQQVLDVLQKLQKRMGNLQPALTALGSDMTARVHRRFDTSTAPDGTPWEPLSDVTLRLFLGGFGNGLFKKDGGLNKKGASRLASRKPLIGESGDLSRQIISTVTGNTLTISSSPVYAAIHQFGGQAGRGLKVTIPARPFMPIQLNGELYPNEQKLVLDSLQEFLMVDL
jgi:phage gpG-like protein